MKKQLKIIQFHTVHCLAASKTQKDTGLVSVFDSIDQPNSSLLTENTALLKTAIKAAKVGSLLTKNLALMISGEHPHLWGTSSFWD